MQDNEHVGRVPAGDTRRALLKEQMAQRVGDAVRKSLLDSQRREIAQAIATATRYALEAHGRRLPSASYTAIGEKACEAVFREPVPPSSARIVDPKALDRLIRAAKQAAKPDPVGVEPYGEICPVPVDDAAELWAAAEALEDTLKAVG